MTVKSVNWEQKSHKKVRLCYVSQRMSSVLLFGTAWYYKRQDAILMLNAR